MRYKLPQLRQELEVVWEQTDARRPTLIFLHDSLGCIELWRDFPEKLAKLCHTNYLMYDRWGYGKSSRNPALTQRPDSYLEEEADILLTLIQDLKIKTPILFGHSDGASIALIAAAKAPDLIQGLITEGAHVFVEDITLEGIRAILPSYPIPLKEKLSKYHGEKVEDIFTAWTSCWLRESFRSWNISSYLSSITCPILIIQGKEDEFGSIKQIEAIEQGVSGPANSWIPEHVGHNPHKEVEAETLEKVLSFMSQVQHF